MSDNGTRRYHNLAGVVRDLEHIRATGGTAEGKDLWKRFVDICDEAFAETLDADDGSAYSAEPNAWDEPDVGDGERQDGVNTVRGPGGVATSIDAMRAELTGLASSLAALKGPTRSVPSGTPALDGAVQRARKVGPRPKVKRAKKQTTKSK